MAKELGKAPVRWREACLGRGRRQANVLAQGVLEPKQRVLQHERSVAALLPTLPLLPAEVQCGAVLLVGA